MQKRLTRLAIILVCILLIPFVMTNFGPSIGINGWYWTTFDYIAWFAIMFFFGLIYELFIRTIHTKNTRVLATILLVLTFLIMYVQLAVGII